MLVMLSEGLDPAGRGFLTRWLQEFSPGVFVGRASALVRDELWAYVTDRYADRTFVQIWPANNEQGYALRVHGQATRHPVDFDGTILLAVRDAAWDEARERFRIGSPTET